jgi:hypothetical protein
MVVEAAVADAEEGRASRHHRADRRRRERADRADRNAVQRERAER